MADYIRLLAEKLDAYSREIQQDTMDLGLELAAVNYNLSNRHLIKKLQDLGKTIDNLAFIRSELVLVKNRIKRRTMYVKLKIVLLIVEIKIFSHFF